MVTAAGWGEAVEFDVFFVSQLVDGIGGRFERDFVTDAGGCCKGSQLGHFVYVICLSVGLILFFSCLVLGIEAFLTVLVCLGLGIPEGFFAVILGVPSISKVFDGLLSGSLHSTNAKVGSEEKVTLVLLQPIGLASTLQGVTTRSQVKA